eukprot:SAG11_NODE_22594_length_403_cov_0.851974_2_plen_22_part_01
MSREKDPRHWRGALGGRAGGSA